MDRLANAPQARPRTRISDIQAVVCASYGLTMEEMKSPSRSRRISIPRQYAMWLCRKMTPASYPKIGAAFRSGEPMDHTSSLFAFRKVERLTELHSDIVTELSAVRRKVEEITALRAMFAPPPPVVPWEPPPVKRTRRKSQKLLTGYLTPPLSKRVDVLDHDSWLSLNGEMEATHACQTW